MAGIKGAHMIDLILTFIPGGWLASIAALIAAGLAVWFGGRKSAKTNAKAKDAEAYRKTRKAMDDATETLGDDPNSARRWLHERGKRSGPL
jgi:hypothetical protein